MLSRHDISDEHWDRIRHLLPGQPGQHGGVGNDTRTFLNAIRYLAKTGIAWADLPSRVQAAYISSGYKIACRSACAHCCCVPVQAYKPEMELIAKRLRETMTGEQLTSLRERIAYVLAERESGKRPRCPLLMAQQTCSIYDVRPLMCRACNSPDVESCRNYEETGDETPCPSFSLPSLFAKSTHLAIWSALYNPNPKPTDVPPESVEFLAALVKLIE